MGQWRRDPTPRAAVAGDGRVSGRLVRLAQQVLEGRLRSVHLLREHRGAAAASRGGVGRRAGAYRAGLRVGGWDHGAAHRRARGARHGGGQQVQGDPRVGTAGGGLAAPGSGVVRDALRVELGAGGRGGRGDDARVSDS